MLHVRASIYLFTLIFKQQGFWADNGGLSSSLLFSQRANTAGLQNLYKSETFLTIERSQRSAGPKIKKQGFE